MKSRYALYYILTLRSLIYCNTKDFFAADIGLSTEFKDWHSIIDQAIDFPDEHMPKIQRTFAHYAMLYGATPGGDQQFKGVELPGADQIDGSIFLRAAFLTLKSAKEGKEERKANNKESANGLELEYAWYWEFGF